MIVLELDTRNEWDRNLIHRIKELNGQNRIQRIEYDVRGIYDDTPALREINKIFKLKRHKKLMKPQGWNHNSFYCFTVECNNCASIFRYDTESITEIEPGKAFVKCPACDISTIHNPDNRRELERVYVYEHPNPDEFGLMWYQSKLFRYGKEKIIQFNSEFEDFENHTEYEYKPYFSPCKNNVHNKEHVVIGQFGKYRSDSCQFNICSCFYEKVMPTETLVLL